MKRSRANMHRGASMLVNSLLALDRRIVERSLRLYKIPKKERIRMRARMRQLHQAVRAIDLNPKNIAVRNSWR